MTWRDHAACAGRDDLFFGAQGGSYDEARVICRACPVLGDCLADALATESTGDPRDHAGMRAGLTPVELVALGRRKAGLPPLADPIGRRRPRVTGQPNGRPPKPIAHGTVAGTRQHYRRGEKPCEECREAYNRHRSDRRPPRSRSRAS